MNKVSLYRSLLLVLLVFGLTLSQARADAALRDMNGQVSSLDQLQAPGEWTVVMIWAADCHVCNQEAGQYVKFHDQHAGQSARVVGMSIDGWSEKDKASEFIDRHAISFPNLIGDVETVARWYAAETGEAFRATPTFLVFGPQGEIKAAQAGAVPPRVIEDFIKANG